MVEIYATLKSEQNYFAENEKNENEEISQQKNYENLIRKLESDLRNHLKVKIFFNLKG